MRTQPNRAERNRTEPNAAEQSRTLPNRQQRLPIECVAESDDAYLSDLTVLVDRKIATEGVAKICRWLIDFGRRECGEKRLRARPQKELGKVLGIAASTVCESLQRLRNSGLVTQADGEYRLRLSQLVELAEVAQTMPEQTPPPDDPEEALAALGGRRVRQRSAAFGDVRQRSATHPLP